MTEQIETSTMEVRKDNWGDTRIVNGALDPDVGEGEVIFKVEGLALTANNISYAASGDALGYWGFFPTAEGWGRIPAMGWGEVIVSAHPDVTVGERMWGWFPFSTHLKIRAGKANARQVVDVSAHRAEFAPVYAQFDRASTNPMYDAAREDQDSLLRGLFMTSWLVEDFLDVNDSFGARDCLVTSASSKTSIALASCLRERGSLTSIGITSAGNIAFCESLGCYDKVVAYENVAQLDANRPAVLVDMAGSAKILSGLHNHYGDNMKYSCRIGATHYKDMRPTPGLPGAKPEFFFAPTHVKVRSAELGAAELMKQMGGGYMGFRQFCDSWLKVERNVGSEAVTSIYQSVLAGKNDPSIGQIISMNP